MCVGYEPFAKQYEEGRWVSRHGGSPRTAEVLELVDKQDLKSCEVKSLVRVRASPSAQEDGFPASLAKSWIWLSVRDPEVLVRQRRKDTSGTIPTLGTLRTEPCECAQGKLFNVVVCLYSRM